MSLVEACGWSLGRSLAVALLAIPVCIWLERRLASLSGLARRVAWVLLVLPFLFPTLLSGYAYAGAGLQLVGSPIWDSLPAGWPAALRQWLSAHYSALDEGLLILLLLTRGVPVGTMILAFAPRPPYSPAAWHCRRLALRADVGPWARCAAWIEYVRYGPWRSVLAGSGLIFLVCFQEFELPSLLGRPAWTVWLHDAQVGGLPLTESLRASVAPVLCQLAVILPLWRGLIRFGAAPTANRSARAAGRPAAIRDSSYLIAAVILACILPVSLVGRGVWQGLGALASNRTQLEWITRGTLVGALFAALAALVAMLAAESRSRRLALGRWVSILALPGLFGPLVLGLALVHAFQWPVLNVAYGTPVPMAAGLVLFLLPRAMLLHAVVQATRPLEARHAAALLGRAADRDRQAAAGELAWRLSHRARFWSVALLSFWGYLEFTIAFLLGPVTIVSVPVLLYNQMHFGKNAVLSAMTFLAVVVPALLFLCAAALRPLVTRWFRQ